MTKRNLVVSTIVAGLVMGGAQLSSQNAFADNHGSKAAGEKSGCGGKGGCEGKDGTCTDKEKCKDKKHKHGKKAAKKEAAHAEEHK